MIGAANLLRLLLVRPRMKAGASYVASGTVPQQRRGSSHRALWELESQLSDFAVLRKTKGSVLRLSPAEFLFGFACVK